MGDVNWYFACFAGSGGFRPVIARGFPLEKGTVVILSRGHHGDDAPNRQRTLKSFFASPSRCKESGSFRALGTLRGPLETATSPFAGHEMSHKETCLCGGIQHEIRGSLNAVVNCHCSDCRKAHGAAFRTRASVKTKDFVWINGKDLLTRYESAPGEFRTFCRVCGSNIVTELSNPPNEYGFALGTLDTDPGVKAECHVFVSDMAPWHEITDDLPRFEEHRPGWPDRTNRRR